jgi:hypothetical protein
MRLLTDEEIKEVIVVKQEDITATLLKDWFARKTNQVAPRFSPTDYFLLPENTCAKNLAGYTTLGLYIFNRLIIDTHFSDITGYINVPITGKTLNKMYEYIAQAFFENHVDADQFFELIDSLDWLGGGDIAEITNVSLSNQLFILPPEIKQRRVELFKQYAKEIAAGDVIIGAKIEQELVNMARKWLETLPEWDNFASDAKLNFDNNYKTIMLMKGPVLNTGTGEWEIATSNYDDGISKEEYALFADSAVYGTFQRAKGVALGGYAIKKIIATLQDVATAPDGTDCGTKDYLTITIDPYFKNEFMYMYIVEGSKLVMLTPNNFEQYSGKTVQMRSPMYCKYPSPELCSKCVGEQPYQLNLKTIGLAATKIGSTLRVKRLKAFHNKKVYIYRVGIDDLMGHM